MKNPTEPDDSIQVKNAGPLVRLAALSYDALLVLGTGHYFCGHK